MGAKKQKPAGGKQQKKRTNKKKGVDAFSKKDWFDVRAPAVFEQRDIGKTLATRTTGTKLSRDSLLGRIFEVSQGDLAKNAEEDSYRIFRLRVEEVQGNVCLTNFYGMRLTTDKVRSICRKWQTLIEASADVRTAEGYLLRVYAIAFTKRRPNQIRKTSYAQSSQVKMIRKRIIEVLTREISGRTLPEITNRLMSQSIGKEIEKVCQSIYPLQNAFVRKIKPLRAPKIDVGKLIDLHGGANAVASLVKTSDMGQPIES